MLFKHSLLASSALLAALVSVPAYAQSSQSNTISELVVTAEKREQSLQDVPVAISAFITDKGTAWGPMSAMGTIIVLPVVVLAVIAQRYLVRGLTAGAVKG